MNNLLKNKYNFEIDFGEFVSHMSQTIPPILSAIQAGDTAAFQLAIIPLVGIVSCINVSSTRGKLLEDYIRQVLSHTLQKAFNLIPKDKIGCFMRKKLDKKLKTSKLEIIVDLDFFSKPGSSSISMSFLTHFCEVLEATAIDIDYELQQIRIVWPRYFTEAARDVWRSNQTYFDELSNDSVFGPMQPYLNALEEEAKYKQQLCLKLTEGLFDGSCCINDIYVDLLAERKWITSEPDVFSHGWIENELVDWSNNGIPGLVVVVGDPGSGKSTILKKAAKDLINCGKHVVYIDLFKIPFSKRTNTLSTLQEYINKLSWYEPLDIEQNPDTVYILDGLDEIRTDVWDNARDLTSQLPLSSFCTNQKVILSGRKKIIEYCSEQLGMVDHYRILPLTGKDHPADLRPILWEKLSQHYKLSVTIDKLLEQDHLKELSANPLLLFLLAWTFNQDSSSLEKINNSVQLYRHILRCVYSRSHGRDTKNRVELGYNSYFNILRSVGACAWLHNSRAIEIKKIREYCHAMGISKEYQNWFEEEKQEKTSRLFLLFFAHETYNQEDESIFEFLHKSFYEYLALEELVYHIHLLGSLQADEAVKRLWYLLSRQLTDSDSIFDFLEDLISETPEKFSDFTLSILNAFTLTQAADIPLATLREPPLGPIFAESTLKDTLERLDCLRKNLWRIIGYIFTTTENHPNLKELNRFTFAGMQFDSQRVHINRIVNADFSQCVFHDIIMPLTQILNSNWYQVGFYDCIFSSIEFDDGSFYGARILGCNFEVSSFQNTIIRESNFDCNRFEGAYFCESKIQNSSFSDCRFDRANFDDAVFESCTFSDCFFNSADFSGAAFHNCTFAGCDFTGSLMSRVKLADFDWANHSFISELNNAQLDDADWDGISDEMRKLLY